MPIKATAAIAHSVDSPLELATVELDDPRPNELLVRILASGVCHTDTLARTMVQLPAVFGHEGMGIVEAVGRDVTSCRPGQKVIISFPACGACPNCDSGQRYWCDQSFPILFGGARLDGSKTITLRGAPISSAFFQQSSFATHAITRESSVVPVTGDQPIEKYAALPCGVITGAGAILNSLKPGPRDSLVVFGAGAVGLSAIMAAKLTGADPIIAVDVKQDRLNIAAELGATHGLNAREGGVAAKIRDIVSRGVQFAFDTSGNEQAFEDAIGCLRFGGTFGFVTAPSWGGKFSLGATPVVVHALNLQGIVMGTARPREFLPFLLDLNKSGRFPYERLIKTYNFTDINQALHDSHTGATIKPVLIM